MSLTKLCKIHVKLISSNYVVMIVSLGPDLPQAISGGETVVSIFVLV